MSGVYVDGDDKVDENDDDDDDEESGPSCCCLGLDSSLMPLIGSTIRNKAYAQNTPGTPIA